MYVPMSETSQAWARVLADRQASTQKAYDFNAQQQADQALPNILFSLGQQNQQQQQGAQQPDIGSAPSQMGAAPVTPVQGSQQIPPIGASQLTPPGQGGPQISRMNPGAIQPPTVPHMASAGADIQRLNPGPPMPQEQSQGRQNPGQQLPSGATPGYDLPSVVQAIKSQYPNIGGAALRNMLTTLNPLILTPAARAQLQMMKQQEAHNNLMERLAVTERGQDTRYDSTTRGQDMRNDSTTRGQDMRNDSTTRGQDMRNDTQRRGQDMRQGAGADEDKVNAAVEYAKQFGIGSIPAWLKPAVMERLNKDGAIKDIPKNIADNAGLKTGEQTKEKVLAQQKTQITLASNILDKSLPSLMDAAKKLGLGENIDFNSLANFAKRHMSSADYANFSTQLRAVASDYSAVINRGQRTTVHSDEEALKILPSGAGMGTLIGFGQGVKAEVGNIKKGISTTEKELKDGEPSGISEPGPNPDASGWSFEKVP